MNPLYYIRYEQKAYRGYSEHRFMWDKPFPTLEEAKAGCPLPHCTVWVYECAENKLTCILYHWEQDTEWKPFNGYEGNERP